MQPIIAFVQPYITGRTLNATLEGPLKEAHGKSLEQIPWISTCTCYVKPCPSPPPTAAERRNGRSSPPGLRTPRFGDSGREPQQGTLLVYEGFSEATYVYGAVSGLYIGYTKQWIQRFLVSQQDVDHIHKDASRGQNTVLIRNPVCTHKKALLSKLLTVAHTREGLRLMQPSITPRRHASNIEANMITNLMLRSFSGI